MGLVGCLHRNVQRNGDLPVGSHRPPGDVFGGDDHVFERDGKFLIVDRHGVGAGLFEQGNVFARHLGDGGGGDLHLLADLLAEDAEVGLNTLEDSRNYSRSSSTSASSSVKNALMACSFLRIN